MSSSDQQDTEKKGSAEVSSSNGLLGLGVAFVIGAVAANVIGFRHSRWAVGKELFRAWERQNAYANARHASSKRSRDPSANASRSSPRTSRASSNSASASRTQSRTGTYSSSGSFSMFEEFMRQAEEEAKRQRERARARQTQQGDASSQSFRREGTQRRNNGHQSEVEDEVLAEMLRMFNNVPGGGQWSSMYTTRGNAKMSADMLRQLEEMIRQAQLADAAARAAGGRGHRRSAGFETFEFWEDFFDTDRGDQHGPGSTDGRGTQGQGSRVGEDSPFYGNSRAKALETLGLDMGASDADVKRAYREQVFKYHPDHYTGSDADGAARKFQDIRQAYEVLR